VSIVNRDGPSVVFGLASVFPCQVYDPPHLCLGLGYSVSDQYQTNFPFPPKHDCQDRTGSGSIQWNRTVKKNPTYPVIRRSTTACCRWQNCCARRATCPRRTALKLHLQAQPQVQLQLRSNNKPNNNNNDNNNSNSKSNTNNNSYYNHRYNYNNNNDNNNNHNNNSNNNNTNNNDTTPSTATTTATTQQTPQNHPCRVATTKASLLWAIQHEQKQ